VRLFDVSNVELGLITTFPVVFDWDTLPDDSVVVDVGGGVVTSARTILKAQLMISSPLNR
jgi:hypothetical protein